jgi:hypothetical protein
MGTRAHRVDKASTLVSVLWGATYPPSGVLYTVLDYTALDPRCRPTGSAGPGR